MEVSHQTKNGTASGTTTGSYVEVFTPRIDGRGGIQGKVMFLIMNTSSTQTMFYKIDGYVYPGSIRSNPVKGETSIGTSTIVVQTDVATPYAEVVLSVKQNSGAGTYQVDYVVY